ncbi:hypothetical protein NKG05_15070 [Oerskovia sp. M15]
MAKVALQQSLTASMSAGAIVPVTTHALLDAAAASPVDDVVVRPDRTGARVRHR